MIRKYSQLYLPSTAAGDNLPCKGIYLSCNKNKSKESTNIKDTMYIISICLQMTSDSFFRFRDYVRDQLCPLTLF